MSVNGFSPQSQNVYLVVVVSVGGEDGAQAVVGVCGIYGVQHAVAHTGHQNNRQGQR